MLGVAQPRCPRAQIGWGDVRLRHARRAATAGGDAQHEEDPSLTAVLVHFEG